MYVLISVARLGKCRFMCFRSLFFWQHIVAVTVLLAMLLRPVKRKFD